MSLPKLSPEEQQKPYASFYNRPLAAVSEELLKSLDEGSDAQDALLFENRNDLLLSGSLAMENGYCRLSDGSVFVAVCTKLPAACTAEMINWWFDWHPKDPLRYKIWFPGAHTDTEMTPAPNPKAGDLPHWNTIHYPTEDIGVGSEKISIRFMSPSDFGFDTSRFSESGVETIICGSVGSVTRKIVHHTDMCHFVRSTNHGLEMRSRFWMGRQIKLQPSLLSPLLEKVFNTKFARQRMLPSNLGRCMARHCAQEYANLGAIVPELYETYHE